MKGKWFSRLESACLIFIALLFTYTAAAGVQQQEIADKVLRLHVIANSDSEEDQRVKLCVRDAVLEYCAPLLEGVESQEQVREILGGQLQEIANIAQETLWQENAKDTVRVQMQEEYYPTREYTDFSLPAGKYVGIRLLIGEAQGHNWWCVIFPPLCKGAAEGQTDTLTPEEHAITRQDGTKYVIRFKTMELLGELRQHFAG